jgi:hypothetical protein
MKIKNVKILSPSIEVLVYQKIYLQETKRKRCVSIRASCMLLLFRGRPAGDIDVAIGLASLAGATHRGLLQRPVHLEDGPEEALHPRRMHHHLPLCKPT